MPSRFIVWGTHYEDERPYPVSEYTFDTEAEMAAFRQGVEAAIGWMDYYEGDTAEYARESAGDSSGTKTAWVDGGMEGPCPQCGQDSGFHEDDGTCEEADSD